MLELSTRELAAAILMLILIALLLLYLRKHDDAKEAFINFLSALLAPVFIVAVVLLFLASLLGVCFASMVVVPIVEVGLWDISMAKDTVFEVLFVGVPALFSGVKARSFQGVFRRIVIPVISFSILLQTYLNLGTFSIVVEFFIQVILLFTAVAPLADGPDASALANSCRKINELLGAFVLVGSTIMVINDLTNINWVGEFRNLLLALWYPLWITPLIWLMAVHDSIRRFYGRAKVTMPSFAKRVFVLGTLLANIRALDCFPGPYSKEVHEADSPIKMARSIRRYKKWLKGKIKDAYHRRSLRDEGIDFSDINGVWLNRSGSKEVKEYLTDFSAFQGVLYKRTGKYDLEKGSLVFRAPAIAAWCVAKISPLGDELCIFSATQSGICYGVRLEGGNVLGEYYESLCTKEEIGKMDDYEFKQKQDCPNWKYDDRSFEAFLR